jgi:hypothetical protein
VIFDAEDGCIIRTANNSKMRLLVKRRKVPTKQSATEVTIYKMKAPYERKTVLKRLPKKFFACRITTRLQNKQVRITAIT